MFVCVCVCVCVWIGTMYRGVVFDSIVPREVGKKTYYAPNWAFCATKGVEGGELAQPNVIFPSSKKRKGNSTNYFEESHLLLNVFCMGLVVWFAIKKAALTGALFSSASHTPYTTTSPHCVVHHTPPPRPQTRKPVGIRSRGRDASIERGLDKIEGRDEQ
jgi:hypothetical protein